MEPDVSICIATCGRPEGLARLLESLRRLRLPPGVQTEVVVVDNDAAGSGRDAALRAPLGGPPLRYAVEPRRNIAHARNRAVAEARGRWLAFVDDDEVVEPDWLAAYLRLVESEPVDACFGPVLPQLERVVTPWLDLEAFYARPRHATGSVVGAADARTGNAFVHRRLFREHLFDPDFGRSGGEDTEFFGRAGGRYLWCDEARVSEVLPPERHRLGWLARRAFTGGFLHSRLGLRDRPVLAVPRALLASVLLVAACPLALPLGRATAARLWLRLCVQAGHLWAFAGGSLEPRAA